MASEPTNLSSPPNSIPDTPAHTPVNPGRLHWFTKHHTRLLKFAFVGLSGVFVNLAIFELCFRVLFATRVDTSVLFVISNACGFIVSVFSNFMLNDVWTWGDRAKGNFRHWLKRLTKYYTSASFAGGIQLLIAWTSFSLLWSSLPIFSFEHDLRPTLSVLTGIGCAMIINFLASHLWAFKDAEPSQ